MTALAYKKSIQNVTPYAPGKPIDEVKRELGLSDIVKMASNENALGPSPKAIEAMKDGAANMHLYPEGGCFYLKEKLSARLGVTPENLVFGTGSNEIIEFIVKGFLGTGKEVISSQYAFAVYPILTQVYGGRYTEVPAREYSFDLEGILRAISPDTQIVFIANPNNPTGTMVSRAALDRFIEQVPEDVLVCIDEAYFEFVADAAYTKKHYYLDRPNVITLRTFSKIYGLAGLRLGYGIANERIVDYFNRIRQPFNVNAMAQAAACAALDDTGHVEKTCAMVEQGKRYLYTELEKKNIAYIPSCTNFILISVDDSQRVFEALLRRGVIVRGLKGYGLNEFIRVTIGTEAENKRFFDALLAVR